MRRYPSSDACGKYAIHGGAAYTKCGLFPDDLELVSAALDRARHAALRTSCELRQQKAVTRIASQGLLPASTPVGVAGFEPTTSSSRTKRATKLRHTPREATTAYRTASVCCQINSACCVSKESSLAREKSATYVTPRRGMNLDCRCRCAEWRQVAAFIEGRREMTGLGASIY